MLCRTLRTGLNCVSGNYNSLVIMSFWESLGAIVVKTAEAISAAEERRIQTQKTVDNDNSTREKVAGSLQYQQPQEKKKRRQKDPGQRTCSAVGGARDNPKSPSFRSSDPLSYPVQEDSRVKVSHQLVADTQSPKAWGDAQPRNATPKPAKNLNQNERYHRKQPEDTPDQLIANQQKQKEKQRENDQTPKQHKKQHHKEKPEKPKHVIPLEIQTTKQKQKQAMPAERQKQKPKENQTIPDERQKPKNRKEKQKTKPPTTGSNPALTKNVPVGTDALDDCGGARPKFGGKLQNNPLLETPIGLSSEESNRKKRYRKQTAKGSHEAKGPTTTRQCSTDSWDDVTNLTAALKASTMGCDTEAGIQSNDWCQMASMAPEPKTTCTTGGENKKKRTRGRKKQSTKDNEGNVEADSSLVDVVSPSVIGDSELDIILQNILLKKQKALDKHEQKMRDASGEQGATMHEYEAQKSEFEASTRLLLARLRAVGHDATSNETVIQLRRRFGVECKRLETALPIYARRTDIVETVRGNAVCVVLGETGSGKSTQLTQYVYEAGAAPGGKIVCTQPRKVAAVSLATRVAHELATPLGGDLVGYRVGLQRRQSDDTALIYVTDHVLLNECLRDPLLTAYSCIIIDEAHERSIFTDLLLGMVKRCLAARADLRVIITSATTDPELFVRYFGGCPVLKLQGPTFPIDVHYETGSDQPDSGDYMDRAFQKVVEIHANEPPGDVLVFVPSALDTEKGCEATRQLDDVVSLPLHGGLPPNEQQQVFDPEINGRRKIVFANNCAETSLAVPGIKYVVDTGLAKERSYDSELNVSSLKLVVISRSSAEQRKGCAGRTAPGTCYRLYSTECCDNMMPTSTPEILRIHLDQAMLKLMDIGVDDPASFQYIESPPPAAMKAAAVALESLGATTNGRINELGWRLSRLNVQPRLGKLILLAIAAGIGYEGMIAAALSTGGGYLCFRNMSNSDTHAADRNTFRMCEESGDVLTFVSFYKQWTAQPERAKDRWCVENSVNDKFMRLARDSITEIKRTLKRDIDVDVKEGAKMKDVNQMLPAILLECYADKLGFFSGDQSTGYWAATGGSGGAGGQTLFLHPSSALASLGARPRWIIYEDVVVTFRSYVTDVTSIDAGLVERFVADGRLRGVDVAALFRRQLRACPLPPVGLSVFRALTGGGFKHLRRLEKETRLRCETDMLTLEASISESRLVVYVMPHLEVAATAVVAESIANEKGRLAAEWSDVALGDGGGGVRVVLGRGGAVTHLLMPDEYRTVVITEASDDADVMHALCQIGPMVNYTRFKAKDKSQGWGEVTFDQPENARRAVNENSGVFSARPVSRSLRSAVDSAFMIKAKWCRRAIKGHAYVMMEDPEDIIRASVGSLLIRGRKVEVNVNRKNDMQLFLTDLPLDAEDSDISTALKLRVDDNDLSITGVVIPREDVGVTSPGELGHLNGVLSAAIKKHVSTGGYRVEINPPKEKDFDFNARISFTNAADGMTALRALNDHVTMNSKPVTFTHDLRTSLTVARPVYDTIREELERIIQLCSRDGNFVNVSKKPVPDARNVVVWVHSDSLPGLQMAIDTVRRVIRAETVQFESTEVFRSITGPVGREELRRIEADTGAKIMVDARVMKLLVHGSETAQRRAVMLVDRFVQDNTALLCKELLLRDFASRGNTVQLMKRLLNNYSVDLEELQRHTGAHYLELRLRRHSLEFRGTEGAYESLQRALREDDAQLTEGSTTKPTTESPNCPLCFCPVDGGDTYRLEYCGHAYCRQCFGALLGQKCRDAEFPVTCEQEDCGEPIVLRDLTNLLGPSVDAKTRWRRAAVESFVKANRNQYRYCVTADCPTIYRAAARDEGVCFRCSQCSVSMCTSCHVHYHEGVTCAAYQAKKRDEKVGQNVCLCEDDLKTWLCDDPTNRVLCPSCATPLEKTAGYDHMECAGCHMHICWNCKVTFQNLKDTYDHLSQCPGGFGPAVPIPKA